MAKILENDRVKAFRSPGFNFNFDKTTGRMETWGTTLEDDPDWSPYGPTIADIETTTICKGPGGKVCSFCYKGNTPKGANMSLDTFQRIFRALPRTLTQIAFGADAQATANPDLPAMMRFCRENDYQTVIPNITVADIEPATADWLSELCGAVAVSRYENKDLCYNSVKMLTDRGMKQVNIHQLISLESADQAMETVEDMATDPRLKDMNAIVFLSLKPKRRGERFHRMPDEAYQALVDRAFELGIRFGFDSCGAWKFLDAVKNRPNYNELVMMTEPCESSKFSLYINHKGEYAPCSFTDGDNYNLAGNWDVGIDLTVDGIDFHRDVWNHPRTKHFRQALTTNHGKCPLYQI